MTLPIKQKTWNYEFTEFPLGPTEDSRQTSTMLQLVNSLTSLGANPWQVHYSSNTVTVGTDGDGVNHWNTNADLVWNTSTHSWIVLRNVDGVEMLIDLDHSPTSRHLALFYLSTEDGFTGGTTTDRPTATDEQQISDSTTWIVNTAIKWNLWVQQSDDGKLSRWYILANDLCVGLGFVEEIEDAPLSPALSYIASVLSSSSVANQASLNNYGNGAVTSSRTWEKSTGFPWTEVSMTADGFSASGSPPLTQPYFEERSNEPYLPEQVVWGLTLGQRGPRGKRTDIWWLSTGPVNTGDTFPAGVTRQFVAVGNFVIPHDGSVPITG